jgi:hypothetical protein
MKKIVLFFVVALFAACKKDNGGSINSIPLGITATIDGVKTTYNRSYSGFRINDSTDIQIQATNSIYPNVGTGISLDITGPDLTLPRVYTDTIAALPTYFSDAGMIYYGANYASYFDAPSSKGFTTITVTVVSKTNIQGTFQGEVYLPVSSYGFPGDTTQAKIVITDGEFNVPVITQ